MADRQSSLCLQTTGMEFGTHPLAHSTLKWVRATWNYYTTRPGGYQGLIVININNYKSALKPTIKYLGQIMFSHGIKLYVFGIRLTGLRIWKTMVFISCRYLEKLWSYEGCWRRCYFTHNDGLVNMRLGSQIFFLISPGGSLTFSVKHHLYWNVISPSRDHFYFFLQWYLRAGSEVDF